MDKADLDTILKLHGRWRQGEAGGIRANLDGADLDGADLDGANLDGASLAGASLTGANLAEARLAGANLAEARLAGANLSGADLRGATGLPEIAAFDLDLAVAEAVGESGEHLEMAHWHSDCGTAHCRAGWAVVLHPKGRELEGRWGTSVAGALIYHACSVLDRVPDWNASDEDALADIRRAADLARSGGRHV